MPHLPRPRHPHHQTKHANAAPPERYVVTYFRRAAYRAAYLLADELTEYDVDVAALARGIRQELVRQEVAFLDRLNDEANRHALVGPEERMPL